MYFENLRVISWEPRFKWVETISECADLINKPHEDYPQRVQDTVDIISFLNAFKSTQIINTLNLFTIHNRVFNDLKNNGEFRKCDVKVGNHFPPNFKMVQKFMIELEVRYSKLDMLNTNNIKNWYSDFETIHPFQDGNGRVGGIVVAVLSHMFNPEETYLAPEQ